MFSHYEIQILLIEALLNIMQSFKIHGSRFDQEVQPRISEFQTIDRCLCQSICLILA
jgi:hypothetical protein